jgi:SM-20-related protein
MPHYVKITFLGIFIFMYDSILYNNSHTLKAPIILEPKSFSLDGIADNLYKNGYAFVKNFLDDIIVQGLLDTIKTIDTDNNLQKAKIGRGRGHLLSTEIRNDKTHWIEGSNDYEQHFLDYLNEIRLALNKNLTLGLFDVEAHYAIYEQGGFYRRHLDSFQGKKNRIVSLVVYLNKSWQISDGGLLNLYHNQQQEYPFASIIPHYNHAVFFLSEQIPHEVTLSHKNRISIACWFRCREMS